MTSSRPRPPTPDRPADPLRAVFPGEGEMARLMRARDWAGTPLGDVASWPQSLRTTVGLALESRHPMLVFWGPRLIQFYNDGFRPILGAQKHPQALGQAGRECWNEVWPIVGPQIEAVMAKGEETWSEDQLVPFDRNGFLEEIYFTYAYSPIREEGGRIGGTLVVCTETTKRVLGERRLHLLAELSARTGEAREIAEACRLAAGVLAEAAADLPFALLYLTGGEGSSEVLVRRLAVGVEPDDAAVPEELAPGDATFFSELASDVGTGLVEVHDLPDEVAAAVAGPWPEPTRAAVVLPVPDRGREGRAGTLVVGLSPRLPFDDGYRSFLELVASQLAAALAGARAREEERRRAEALAALDRSKTAFFSSISHEFRTPLTLILGALESARDTAAPRVEGEDLELVRRNAQRLLRLVNTLLDVAQIEAGRFRATFAPLDLGRTTAHLASSFRSLVESAGLRFEVDCAELGEPVWVDRPSWEKVVLNLLSNAFKFTFEGRIAVRLRRGVEASEDVVLEVEDTGVGIPEEELDAIFDRFHRVRDTRSRSFEGSGIGLALVKELVERHGGTIEVASRLGEGTTFRVRLRRGTAHLPADRLAEVPTVPSDAGEEGAAGVRPWLEEAERWLPESAGLPAREPALRSGGEQVRRILVADDNADLRAYLVRLLGSRWSVEAVGDGTSALERLRRDPPDLLVADVMMPGLDGLELVRTLRATEDLRDLPVLLLSARAGEEARLEGLEAGANEYLVKPFSALELVARVESQLALARERRTAAAYRRLLHGLVMSAPAAVTILRGPELVYELVNPAAQQILGVGRQILGRPIAEAVPELAEQGFVGRMRQVLETGKRWQENEVPVEFDRAGDGNPEAGWFTFSVARVPGVGDEPDGIATFGWEVSDLVVARRRSEELLARVREEARRKDEFLSMLSHELRVPLAPVASAVRLLSSHDLVTEDPERLRWAVAVVDRQVRQMVRLVDDLLDIDRVSRGVIRLRRSPTALDRIVASAVEGLGDLPRGKEQRLDVDLPTEPVLLDVDPTRATQILGNLLHNASKYTPARGRIRLVGRVDAAERQAVVVVEDDGDGIESELLSRVFDLFTQGERALDRAEGGLGIGLTVVRRLVELHGGSVDAASGGKGKGSRFTVRLPLAAAGSASEVAAATGPEPDRSFGDDDGELATELRLLVVDDDPDTAEALGLLLELEGHRVTVARSADRALDAARETRPDVALVDIGMPGMDGYELAGRLREEHGGGLALVAVSGYGSPEDRARARQSGFDEHLIKPVDFERLLGVLDELARRAAAEAGS